MAKILRAADLFCGAGGSTTGAEASGCVKVVFAVNHWIVAIQTHRQNHPDVHHVCARIDQIDPVRDVPDIDLLIASPECTHHANALGGRPMCDQSRATGWDVIRWAEAKQPEWIVVENVQEWQHWGPLGKRDRPLKSKRGETFNAWLRALGSLNYRYEWKLLNAADYGEATSRVRLFVIARRGRGPIVWPFATHSRENWRPARDVIDWSRPCPSIFGRGLVENTMRRIAVGIERFCGEDAGPFLLKLRGTSTVASIDDPLPTITAGGNHLALCVPFLISYYSNGKPQSLDRPLSTITTRHRHALVVVQKMKDRGIVDVGMRMLHETENARGMGFPEGYQFYGTQKQVFKMIGNAVSTRTMQAICKGIAAA